MKTSSLLAAASAAVALALAPSAASAVPDGPDGAGYNGGAAEAVIVNDDDPTDCTVPITVEAGNAGTVTVTVTDATGAVIDRVEKANDPFGTVDFVVSLGEDCAGSYNITATDEGSNALASAMVDVEGASPVNSGGGAGGEEVAAGESGAAGDDAGGLPATGSSDLMLYGGLAGAGLLAGGSLLLLRRRRAGA